MFEENETCAPLYTDESLFGSINAVEDRIPDKVPYMLSSTLKPIWYVSVDARTLHRPTGDTDPLQRDLFLAFSTSRGIYFH